MSWNKGCKGGGPYNTLGSSNFTFQNVGLHFQTNISKFFIKISWNLKF